VPLFAFLLVDWYENKYDRLPVLGGTMQVNGKEMPHRVHPFTLVNQDGQLFYSAVWQQKIVVVNFFFTHCGSICPKMTWHLQSVAKAFVGNQQIQLVSCTVDPERDTPLVLKQYAAAYDIDSSQWNLLTGKKKDIYRLARKEFFLTATDGDGGENDFIHSDQLVLLDGQQQIRGYYSGIDDKQVKQLIHDIKKLSHE
jgi:protein SCO1/2